MFYFRKSKPIVKAAHLLKNVVVKQRVRNTLRRRLKQSAAKDKQILALSRQLSSEMEANNLLRKKLGRVQNQSSSKRATGSSNERAKSSVLSGDKSGQRSTDDHDLSVGAHETSASDEWEIRSTSELLNSSTSTAVEQSQGSLGDSGLSNESDIEVTPLEDAGGLSSTRRSQTDRAKVSQERTPSRGHDSLDKELSMDGSMNTVNPNSNTFEESRLLTTMNHLSVASINIAECQPSSVDDEIHRQTFETWKDLLINSMELAGIQDEKTKQVVFKVKAGPRLLEIYRNTKSTADAPNPELQPFSNAMFRLKSYFGSGSDILLQRRKLATAVQQPKETDLKFITRIGAIARLCDFGEDNIFGEIARAVSQHARRPEVRTLAMKLISRGGGFTELVDRVRELEAIKINEEYAATKQPAAIAHVRTEDTRNQVRYQPYSKPQRSASVGGRKSNRYRSNFQDRDRRNDSYSSDTRDRRAIRDGSNMRAHDGGQDGNSSPKCWRCKSHTHLPSNCKFQREPCHRCGELGHIRSVCKDLKLFGNIHQERQITRPQATNTRNVATVEKKENNINEEELEIPLPTYNEELLVANISPDDDGTITAEVAGMKCVFLIDSGAQVNTLTSESFHALKREKKFHDAMFNIQDQPDFPLKAYATPGQIPVVASFEAELYISDDRPINIEKFYVVNESRSLLGRSTSIRYSVLRVGLDIPIISEPDDASFSRFAGEIATLASNEAFPRFNLPPVKIDYDRSMAPCRNVFMNIPQALKPLVEQRLRQLIAENIIERVTDEMDTSFCSSMLVVPKGHDDIRLVIDLRGPNKYIKRTPFSMPTHEKILAELNGARWFSTIDLSNAFFHIVLDEESRHLTNFFTEYGMFRFVRLPFGLCNAPDIFQETLQRIILEGCLGVKNYLDDILVFGRTKTEHDQNLKVVLDRLKQHNVKLNMQKCVFGSTSVTFLGFTLTADGWQIEEGKLSAIRNFRRPATCAEVKSFLGLLTFFDKFIMNRADKTERLRCLANAERFYWTSGEEEEFTLLKDRTLDVIKRLGYYSTTDRTELFVDASPIGLGAVLTQYNEEGIPRIIACASKALSAAEKRYPHTQKEALAIVWGVEKYSYYLLHRPFVVRTDSEANQFIFAADHTLGKRAVTRAGTWALRLSAYKCTVERVPGAQNVADALSRLIHESEEAVPFEREDENHLLYTLDPGCMAITWDEVETNSELDQEFKQIRAAITSKAWPDCLRRYEAQRKHLYINGELIFKDNKVLLPMNLRRKALSAAHEGHVGEAAMKKIVRNFFWWPGISSEVVRFVKNCSTCAALARKNPPLPLSSRELPSGPWQILQIDFLSIPGFGTGEFLIVVDTYSRYLSVVEMKSTNAESTNAALCEIFKMWGLPIILQSDNGPPFQGLPFIKYWEDKGVKVRKSIPLSPQSNGCVERQNQAILKAVSAAKLEGTNWRIALKRFVHNHNTLVPHSRLNVTPFELLVGFKFRGTFPCLWDSEEKGLDRTDIEEKDAEAKLVSKKHADSSRGARESNIKCGDEVLVAQFKKNKTDPSFSTERFKVIARDGAKVVVLSKNGVQYSRNVQDVRKAPELDNTDDEHHSPTSADLSNRAEQDLADAYEPEEESASTEASTVAHSHPDGAERNLRQRKNLKKPSRYDNRYVYNIFE